MVNLAWLVYAWLPYSISAIISTFGTLGNPLKCGEREEVDIVITTVASLRVKKTLLETIDQVVRIANGKVFLLTEPDAEPEILSYAKDKGIEVIIVPKAWRNGQAKGRAIWYYFSQNFAQENRWYLLLDDDSYPLDNHFQYEVKTAEAEGRLIGNCVLLPRRGRALLPLLCDNLRYADDCTIFRLCLQVLKTPLIGMHGEGLLVKGSILKEYWKDIFLHC